MKVPDRVRWALSVVDPGPADRVLEIGCGPGVAAALVCSLLETGHLLAIDRSAVAVRRTAERNASYVDSGRLSVKQVSLGELSLPPASLDKAFCVNVNLFWVGNPAAELAVLRKALRQGGQLYILYGDGPTKHDRVTPMIADALRDNGFTQVEVLTGGGVGVRAKTR
ncbi:class I SAM-dependent methyltransferase [Kibdelosporangium philippinense]|uniref:Class I SAM-dependent methyltransferase n=1 Tax=Kibdelosporangium philippinense TaxID=211113 RepID=A0ABS8ZWK4_9PSEU|nr:class I SAM-dependent methyltransferase [Kibdelosporangium philippinense]MCE7011410.1 class I SAM-dependent methyltransferase [Kibdelosporangium philippinense]